MKTYEDPAESGDKFKRPKLQEMLFDVKNGEIDVVVTIKMDRISRSVRDFHEILTILEDNDVSLVSVTQGFDTSTPAGKLLRNILIDFAQFERDMISERTKEKRLARAKKGLWNGGIPPFGYKTENKRLTVIPKEAEAVKLAYSMYARTKSMNMVRKELELKGIKTRAGKNWAKSSIHKILSNPVYIGKLHENGKYFKGQHEAIIKPSLFNKVQKIVPKIIYKQTRTDRIYTLRGLVKCGHHKCAMTPYHSKGRKEGDLYYYYLCTKKQNYRKVKCPVAYTKAEELENYVVEKLEEISSKKDVFEQIVKQVNLDLEAETIPYQKELDEVNSRILEINNEIENFLDAIGKSGSKVINLLEKKVEKLQDDLQELENRKSELKMLISSSPSKINAQIVLDGLKDFSELYDTFLPGEQAEYLQRILRDIIVTDKKVTINIFGTRKPVSKGGSSWLPSTDSNRGPSG